MIEVICGPMFSGKTEELIRRIRRLQYANTKFLLFKPTVDERYDKIKVTSHNKNWIDSIPIQVPGEITHWLSENPDTTTIAIDEVQFLGIDIVYMIRDWDKNYRVIVAGLDMDYRGNPFGMMQGLLPIADRVDKLSAVCIKCGADAKMSYKLSGNGDIVDIGGTEKYEARCIQCWEKPLF